MTERGLSVIRKLSTAASARALRIRRYAPHTRGAEGHSPSETPPTMRNPRCGGHSVPLRHSSLFPHLQTLDHAPLRRRYRMLNDTNITNDSENNKFGYMFLRAMAAFRREGPFSSLPLSSAAGLSARGHVAASGFGEGRRCAKGVRGLRKIPDRRERGRGCGIHAEGEDGGGAARRGTVRCRGRRLFFEDVDGEALSAGRERLRNSGSKRFGERGTSPKDPAGARADRTPKRSRQVRDLLRRRSRAIAVAPQERRFRQNFHGRKAAGFHRRLRIRPSGPQ